MKKIFVNPDNTKFREACRLASTAYISVNAMFKKNFKGLMLILLIVSIFSGCSIRKMCTNYDQPFKIVDYTKSVHVYTVESLNCNCFVSFRIYDNFKIGDTIQVTYVNRTDLVANLYTKMKL